MNPQLLLTNSPPPSSGNEDEFGDGKRRDFSEKMNLELGIWSCACVSEGSLKKKKKINQGLSLLNSDYSSKMDDIEPGRCRRSDGRKWRCSKNVILNEKYCERHMHRGSRKLVDTHIQTVSKPDNKKTSISDDTKMAPFSLITRHTKENETGFENGHPRKNISSNKRSLDKNKDIGFVSTVFGLSPKSVLNRDSGKTNLDSGNKNGTIETGPQRCRRTDGKKWQCKRNSIPNQKYCETHMHRGAKRLFLHAESSGNDPRVTDSSDLTAQISRTMIRNLDNRINLNTMPESPQQISSSSTSDATTITDENISISLTPSLYKF